MAPTYNKTRQYAKKGYSLKLPFILMVQKMAMAKKNTAVIAFNGSGKN
ncbi:hypothetical protein EMIT036CA2_11258 [Chryseobacterium sp. IT-36CA2]